MQSIQVATADLSAAIERAALAYDATGARRQPDLAFALLSADAGAFSVTVTDLDREITAHAGGELGGAAFECLALFDPLRGAVKQAKAAKAPAVRLELIDDGDAFRLVITAGARSFKIPARAGEYPETVEGVDENGKRGMIESGAMLRAVDEFPRLFRLEKEGAEHGGAISGAGRDFAEALAAGSGAMSTEETRYYLNGVYLAPLHAPAPGMARAEFVSTDGHRLERAPLPYSLNVDARLGVIVPAVTVKTLLKLAPKAPRVDVAYTETLFTVTGPAWRLVSKLVDGTYPDYNRVIPRAADASAKVTLDAAEIREFLTGALAISADRTKSVRFEVNGAFSGSVNNPEAGEFSQRFAHAEIQKADAEDVLTFGLNGRYLSDIVRDADAVTLHLKDGAAPILITSPDWQGERVLMPLRV